MDLGSEELGIGSVLGNSIYVLAILGVGWRGGSIWGRFLSSKKGLQKKRRCSLGVPFKGKTQRRNSLIRVFFTSRALAPNTSPSWRACTARLSALHGEGGGHRGDKVVAPLRAHLVGAFRWGPAFSFFFSARGRAGGGGGCKFPMVPFSFRLGGGVC